MTKPIRKNSVSGPFVLNNEAEYPWTVKVHVPNPKGGARVVQKLPVRFRHLTPQRRLDILEEHKSMVRERASRLVSGQTDEGEDEAEAEESLDRKVLSFQVEVLQEALVSFECVDGQGNTLEPNDENRELLFSNSWALDAIFQDYLKSLSGRSTEGN